MKNFTFIINNAHDKKNKQTNKQKKNLSLATYTTTNPIVFVVTRSSSKDSAALRANTQCFKSRPAETDRINWYPISNAVISQYPVCLSPVTNQHQVRYTYTQTNDQSANSKPTQNLPSHVGVLLARHAILTNDRSWGRNA